MIENEHIFIDQFNIDDYRNKNLIEENMILMDTNVFLPRNRISAKSWHITLLGKIQGQLFIHLLNKTNKCDILITQFFPSFFSFQISNKF